MLLFSFCFFPPLLPFARDVLPFKSMCLTHCVWGGKKERSMCTQVTGFLRFLGLEFMPGFKHFRKNSLEAPRGCQKASWQMGCSSMTWCKRVGGHACSACHGPDASLYSTLLFSSGRAAGSTLPGKGNAPRETLLASSYWSHPALL